jgi:hypothetical protein
MSWGMAYLWTGVGYLIALAIIGIIIRIVDRKDL